MHKRAPCHTAHLLTALMSVAVVAACGPKVRVQGNGQIAEARREVGAFTQISISDDLQAEVQPGPTSVVLHFDSNLLPHVRTEVSETTLTLATYPGEELRKPSTSGVMPRRLGCGRGRVGGKPCHDLDRKRCTDRTLTVAA